MSELRADPAGNPSQTQLCNALPVFSPRGDLLGVMRKVHINRYETGGGWRNGSEFPVWDFRTPTGQFRGGIMVCYDRELPESGRILMLKGADVIFNPLACGCPTSDIHRCLLRTRAFENELFVFMVNHAAPRENGHSMVFDFMGNIVKEMDDKEGVFVYDLDLDALNKHREKGIYAFHHRRPELYGILSDPAGQVHPPEANLPPAQLMRIAGWVQRALDGGQIKEVKLGAIMGRGERRSVARTQLFLRGGADWVCPERKQCNDARGYQ